MKNQTLYETQTGKPSTHYCFTCKRTVKYGPEMKAHQINGHIVDPTSQEYYETVESESDVRP